MRAAPPTEILGSVVVDIRDVWTVDDRVYCEVRTANGWIATCLLVDAGEWHVCHAYKRDKPSLYLIDPPTTASDSPALLASA